jgi:hypothetical protein
LIVRITNISQLLGRSPDHALAGDYIHSYRSAGGRHARCRIRIYLPEDVRDMLVVICSELPNNPGGSITNSAETIAAGVILNNEIPTPRHPPDDLLEKAGIVEQGPLN